MRTTILSTILTAALILPGAASGVEFVSVAGVADCNGWSSEVQIWFRDGATSVELAYAVVLTDAGGAEVQRFDVVEPLAITPGPPVSFTFSGAFAAAPGEGSLVTAEFRLYDYFTDGFNESTAGFSADPACTPPVDDRTPVLCTHTARWWSRHQDDWPVDELAVGADTWDARTLRHVLRRPAWGNLRLLLARQLVAAKFNAMTNPGAGMDAAIAAADDFLVDHDPFSRVRGRDWRRRWREEARTVRDLIVPLIEFNRAGCTTEPVASAEESDLSDLDLVNKALAGEPVVPQAEENVSFGTLKALYR